MLPEGSRNAQSRGPQGWSMGSCSTSAPEARTFSATGLLILQVRDGRIVHARDYMDSLGTYRELDQLPALVAALRT